MDTESTEMCQQTRLKHVRYARPAFNVVFPKTTFVDGNFQDTYANCCDRFIFSKVSEAAAGAPEYPNQGILLMSIYMYVRLDVRQCTTTAGSLRNVRYSLLVKQELL